MSSFAVAGSTIPANARKKNGRGLVLPVYLHLPSFVFLLGSSIAAPLSSTEPTPSCLPSTWKNTTMKSAMTKDITVPDTAKSKRPHDSGGKERIRLPAARTRCEYSKRVSSPPKQKTQEKRKHGRHRLNIKHKHINMYKTKKNKQISTARGKKPEKILP